MEQRATYDWNRMQIRHTFVTQYRKVIVRIRNRHCKLVVRILVSHCHSL